jgi:hypothetical protein
MTEESTGAPGMVGEPIEGRKVIPVTEEADDDIVTGCCHAPAKRLKTRVSATCMGCGETLSGARLVKAEEVDVHEFKA